MGAQTSVFSVSAFACTFARVLLRNSSVAEAPIKAFGNFLSVSANVAQLVEQRFRKARVVSSILTVGSTS